MRTEITRKLPPFFTQVIGSLPRPKMVQGLHARRHQMSEERFQKVMDEIVLFAIRLQEEAGLDVVSDGEWRRIQYVDEFLHRIGGFEKIRPFEHAGEKKFHLVVNHRMGGEEPVFTEDARFLARHTSRVKKFALPSPFLVAIRYWHESFSTEAYPTVQHFMDHFSEILAREARALQEAGMDIIQLDDPALTYFCDRKLMDEGETHDDRLRRRWDPERQIPEAVGYINRVFEGLKAEVHLHCCHSVYKRQSDVSGDYKPLLPLLEGIRADRLNLEFAYQGTGDISDLNLLPEGVGVGMGVLDVRSESVQDIIEIESLALAGAEAIGADRIALNPDCGFAPDMGELPSIDEAFEKLCRLAAAARSARQKTGIKVIQGVSMAGLQGILSVLCTPFQEDGSIDKKSLKRLVEHNLSWGVDGLVCFGLASEIYKLSDRQRDDILELVVGIAAGSVPVIAGTEHSGVETAAARSQETGRAGATAVMLYPPMFVRPTPSQVKEYYEEISQKVRVPIIIQDAPTWTGVHLPVDLLFQIKKSASRVECVKVEAPPTAPKMSALLEQGLTPLGGYGALHLFEEMTAGVTGTMPG